MTILKKIGLSKRYGKAIYSISAVLTLAISSLVFFNPYAIPMAILLKLVSIPIILYLYTTFTKKTEIYFYLNLGGKGARVRPSTAGGSRPAIIFSI